MSENKTYSLAGAIKVIQQFVPTFQVKAKADSKSQKVLAKVNFFNPQYMTDYWTTQDDTVYYPIAGDQDNTAWQVIFHEGRHSIDSKNLGLKGLAFDFLYSTPPILAPILFALGFWCWPFFVAAAVSLLPIPSPFRAWAEFRGYGVTQAIEFWTGASAGEWWIDNQMLPQFAGWSYYKMLALNPIIRWYFRRNFDRLKSGEILNDPYMKAVHDYVKAGDASK